MTDAIKGTSSYVLLRVQHYSGLSSFLNTPPTVTFAGEIF